MNTVIYSIKIFIFVTFLLFPLRVTIAEREYSSGVTLVYGALLNIFVCVCACSEVAMCVAVCVRVCVSAVSLCVSVFVYVRTCGKLLYIISYT